MPRRKSQLTCLVYMKNCVKLVKQSKFQHIILIDIDKLNIMVLFKFLYPSTNRNQHLG